MCQEWRSFAAMELPGLLEVNRIKTLDHWAAVERAGFIMVCRIPVSWRAVWRRRRPSIDRLVQSKEPIVSVIAIADIFAIMA